MAARELAEAGDDVAARLWQVFQEFDANGDGRIDAGELRLMMDRVGLSMTRDEASEVLAEMDQICQGLLATAMQGDEEAAAAAADNNFEDDGELNFEEFYAVLLKLEGARAYTAASLGAAAAASDTDGDSTKLTIRSIAGTIEKLRARTSQKGRWGNSDASAMTLQDVRTEQSNASPSENQKRRIATMLEEVPLLSTLTADAKAQLLDLVTVRRFKRGQDIVRKGDEGHEFFLIVRGRVLVLDADENVIVELAEGKHFGERSLIISEPRNATIRCAVECEVASVHRNAFTQILDAIGGKERARRRRLAQRREMARKRDDRAQAKHARAEARAKAGRKRPTGRRRRFSAIDDWSAARDEEERDRKQAEKDKAEEENSGGEEEEKEEQEEKSDEEDQSAPPPPAGIVLRSTMADLDSLLDDAAQRHNPIERGWKRAVAARSRPPPRVRKETSLPALEPTSSAASPGPGLPPARARRGAVGAAGQTLMMVSMAAGVPREMQGSSSAARAVDRGPPRRRKPQSLPALALQAARARRLRATTFRSERSGRSLGLT